MNWVFQPGLLRKNWIFQELDFTRGKATAVMRALHHSVALKQELSKAEKTLGV